MKQPAARTETDAAPSPTMLWALSIGLVAITALIYAPVANHPFFTFDDPGYVYENPKVKAGLTFDGLKWALTTGHFANWHPLTWLSHMLDVQLFGLNAGAHHVVNVVFHAANTVLLFFLMWRMTKAWGPSAVVAALFAVHPMHVESVAWIAERKDVLSTLLWILTTWAYVNFVRQRSVGRYALVVVLYALGLMSKPMLVTLPAVLLLLDVWPLRQVTLGVDPPAAWKRVVLEKLPLLAMAAASSVVTVLAQRSGGAVQSLVKLPTSVRVANAIISYSEYMQKLVWPTRMGVLYPYPDSVAVTTAAAHLMLLAVVTIVVARLWRRHPYLLVGWLWFLGTLVPVIGLVQVGKQSMADRYTYVPAIGLFIMIAWGAVELARRVGLPRVVMPVLASVVVAAYSLVARTQVGYWSSSTALWSHTIDVTPTNYLAENNLGFAFAAEKKHAEAVRHYEESIRINPRFAAVRTNLALSLVAVGRVDDAIAQYTEALKSFPEDALVHGNLGVALALRGRLPEAIAHYQEAIRLQPDYDEAQGAYGLALARMGRVDEAIEHYNEALKLNPKLAEVHSNLGSALASQGRVAEAVTHFEEAVRLKPDYVDARNNLGVALSSLGQLDEAIAQFTEATRLNPRSVPAHFGLGSIFETQGRVAEATAQFAEILRIDPNNVDAQRALERLRNKPR